jgi:hypothetical protein
VQVYQWFVANLLPPLVLGELVVHTYPFLPDYHLILDELAGGAGGGGPAPGEEQQQQHWAGAHAGGHLLQPFALPGVPPPQQTVPVMAQAAQV